MVFDYVCSSAAVLIIDTVNELIILNIYGYILMFNQTDSVETIKKSFQSITKEFPADIQSSDVLLNACLHFKELMKIEEKLFTSVENSVTFTMSSYIKNKELDDVFPNLNTVLRMFLSTAVANCTGERSFSVLKRVKNYLRSTMSEERLNALALLNIEN